MTPGGSLAGAVLGALLGAGVLLVARGVAAGRADPVARVIGDTHSHASGGIHRVMDRWDAVLDPARRGRDRRLVELTPSQYRRQQVIWAIAAAVGTGGLYAAGAVPRTAWWSVLLAAPAGLAAREWHLTRTAEQARRIIGYQTAAVAEIVALAVTAGEAPSDALGRAAGAIQDPLGPFLAEAARRVRSGESLDIVLKDLDDALEVPELSRLCATMRTASARGTPLANTLLGQAGDLRRAQQARELERAGRREVAMLVPVVFLVLPCVVAVAVFPGAVQLMSVT